MGYLDNLENSLKNLETADERAAESRHDARRRETERAQLQAAAPFAEQLKHSPFTGELLSEATRIGHRLRTKVHMVWLGDTLRLDARERRLELQPTAQGIVALFLVNGEEVSRRMLDLGGSPADLAREFLEPPPAGSSE
ncbi:MAG: hypothetical protein IT160_18115 [Bryobacterales bacterium]|nr:hypothetical protein [Bryobacterales bacterium]